MNAKILRGRVLSFNDAPKARDDQDCFTYIQDGALLLVDGKITAQGSYSEIAKTASAEVQIIDHRPHIIMAGFIDTHIHFPQMQVLGSYAGSLLEWLNTYTFVEEQRFGDLDHARRIAGHFYDELIRHGTTSAAAYCSVHPQSVDAYFEEANKRDMLMIGGKVMMDREAPIALTDTPQSSYDDSKTLIEKWHGHGRAHYAITPRFAITSTPEQLEMAQALAQEHPDMHIQTHLSENKAEIEFTNALYPAMGDYFGIYQRYGLAGAKSLFGHCIHLETRERDAMIETGSVAVFCPTSNLFIGSGLFDWARIVGPDGKGRVAIATDVGGGTNYSMLRTLDEGYKVLNLQGQRMNPLTSFYQITLGNARALSLESKIGNLAKGSDADIVILNANATPAMQVRMETITTLEEELFLLQTAGDDRAIVETYVAGIALKSILN